MNPFFCAIANQKAQADLIGTAGHYQTYVLIECPMPWAAQVFESACIPLVLRQYIKALKAEGSIQFLAIDRGRADRRDASPSTSITVMVYERTVPSGTQPVNSVDEANRMPESAQPEQWAGQSLAGYRGYEFQLDSLEQSVECLEAHWRGDCLGQPINQKDILVCTHGMRDKCCARFGQPFFKAASQSVKQGDLPSVRLWRVSHIGGHRFAPTAIAFPDGRYYGRLTLSALRAIVMRSGPIHLLRSVYRGWGVLPFPLQVLEQQLLLRHGWAWFDHAISYRMLSETPEDNGYKKTPQRLRKHDLFVEVLVKRHVDKANAVPSITGRLAVDRLESGPLESDPLEDVTTILYRASITQSDQPPVYVKASCSSAVPSPLFKYVVTDCTPVKGAQLTRVSTP